MLQDEDASNQEEPLPFHEQFPGFEEFDEEDGLLFWNGYLVSANSKKVNLEFLMHLRALCNDLVQKGMNPEEQVHRDLDKESS